MDVVTLLSVVVGLLGVLYLIWVYLPGFVVWLVVTAYCPYSDPKTIDPKVDYLNLPRRGEVLQRDYRSKKRREAAQNAALDSNNETIRIISLNMEMGKQMDKIISELKLLNADVICLQEVDMYCLRSGNIDQIAELAMALDMNSFFTCEVEKPDHHFPGESLLNKIHLKQGANNSARFGREGNGILTRFDFVNTAGITIKCGRVSHFHDSYKMHCEAFGAIKIPFLSSSTIRENNSNSKSVGFQNLVLHTYSVHFDPHFTGVEGRTNQYLELLQVVQKNKSDPMNFVQVSKTSMTTEKDRVGVVIAGDFNTAITGLAKFNRNLLVSSKHSTLGSAESQIFDVVAVKKGNEMYNERLADPFDKVKDVTFVKWRRWLYQAKLDWCVYSQDVLEVVEKMVGADQSCSDHNWLLVECKLR